MRYRYLFIISCGRVLFLPLLLLLYMLPYPASVSGQVHIGSVTPPAPSAMLEVSDNSKGILFPSVPLNSIYDSMIIVNGKPVDGLLIFNTTNNPLKNLFKGLYMWNGARKLWDNAVSTLDFGSILTSHYAIAETYFVANIQERQSDINKLPKIDPGSTAVLLPFESWIINKDNRFTGKTTFTVPAGRHYRVICGMEIYGNQSYANEVVTVFLRLTYPSGKIYETHVRVARANMVYADRSKVPLTPSLFYSGYLEKNVKLTMSVLFASNTAGRVSRKYLYIDAF